MKATAFTLVRSEQVAALPRRIEAEVHQIHEARIEALKRLGARWLLHPAYVPDMRHSNNPEVYKQARQPFLAEIARRAAADRERRDSFKRAQAVRNAMGGVL